MYTGEIFHVSEIKLEKQLSSYGAKIKGIVRLNRKNRYG